ncbi:MAG: DUF2796 domain-containing protein [Nitrosomonadales bacterium]|nr:DUF2796 domain-containing protein [Nitrosomonadales bacterium]
MTVNRFIWLPFLLVPLCGVAAEAHVHGMATLQIAVDGKTLQLNLESPLDSLLGFEHQPRTNQQKIAVKDMEHRLRQAGQLFKPTPAANCTLKSVALISPVLETGKDHGHQHDDHANLDGEFIFECAKPTELRDLEVILFDSFPRLRQLKAEAATPRGQTAVTLTPARRKVSW